VSGEPAGSDDEALLTRLRDLALVDLDALLVGAAGEHYARLLVAHAEDLEDALRAARGRAAELQRLVAGDPLTLLEAPFASRARDGGRDAAERSAKRLAQRAQAARALARLDDLAANLFPRLLEADRRRASLGS
jgi:hypothetical protein